MQFVEAYFDESGSDDGSPVLCLAGYIFDKNSATSLDDKWMDILAKFKLPFFRMSSCAQGVWPFKDIPKEDRIEIEKRMIHLIKDHASFGVAVTVDPKEFYEVMPKSGHIGSAYTLCAHTCLAAVKSWADEIRFSGDISYFFESGHRSQSEANGIMNRLFSIPKLREAHRYGSHTFADKEKARLLQAADLLAWQWHSERKRKMIGARDSRKDFLALVEGSTPPLRAMHYGKKELRVIANVALSREYPTTYP